MTKKAIKCSECGLYYDRFVYTTCPFCSKKTPVPESPIVSPDPKPESESGEKKIKTVPVNPSPHENEQNSPPVAQDGPGGVEPPMSLQKQIQKSGRTVGRYTPRNGDSGIDPVVGWVICVKGAHFGQSFPLKSGKNRIGRSHEMNVRLMDDDSVSRTCVAEIVFDTKACVFSILPGQSESLCYVNGSALYSRLVLQGYEEMEFGDTGRNKFVFLPLCGEKFQWTTYEETAK